MFTGAGNYDPEDESEFQEMSNVLQNASLTSSFQEPSSSSHWENVDFVSKKPVSSHSVIPKPVFNSFSSFASILDNSTNASLYRNESLNNPNNPNNSEQPIYNFSNCQVNISSATPIPTQSIKPHKKKIVHVFNATENKTIALLILPYL